MFSQDYVGCVTSVGYYRILCFIKIMWDVSQLLDKIEYCVFLILCGVCHKCWIIENNVFS